MLNRISGAVIVILLLSGGFMLFGQENREAVSKETFHVLTDGAGRQVSVPVQPKKWLH